MKSTPHVSVLMPVYNGEKYLKEAIDSVLNQTYTDFELLIINDGSQDKTQVIIDSYNDPRIKCHTQINQGVAKSLNKGLKLANGTYVWRHDADDICLPTQLEIEMRFLSENPNFLLVSTQIAFMSDNGKIAHSFKQPKDDYFQGKSFIKVERSQFNPYSPITHATVLVKKDVFDKVGIYRTEFKTSEDTDLWLRIIEHYDVAVLNFCSYFVRLNTTSATQIYKNTNNFYRNLAFQFADERTRIGTDMLQRGEPMPKPSNDTIPSVEFRGKGRVFRGDLLHYRYKVLLNAKDYKNVIKIMKISIREGWKLSSTWKALLFPLIGQNLINKGVSLKQKFK